MEVNGADHDDETDSYSRVGPIRFADAGAAAKVGPRAEKRRAPCRTAVERKRAARVALPAETKARRRQTADA